MRSIVLLSLPYSLPKTQIDIDECTLILERAMNRLSLTTDVAPCYMHTSSGTTPRITWAHTYDGASSGSQLGSDSSTCQYRADSGKAQTRRRPHARARGLPHTRLILGMITKARGLW